MYTAMNQNLASRGLYEKFAMHNQKQSLGDKVVSGRSDDVPVDLPGVEPTTN